MSEEKTNNTNENKNYEGEVENYRPNGKGKMEEKGGVGEAIRGHLRI